MQTEHMGTEKVNRLILKTGIPLMLSLLMNSLYNFVDSVFVSRVAEDALTALSGCPGTNPGIRPWPWQCSGTERSHFQGAGREKAGKSKENRERRDLSGSLRLAAHLSRLSGVRALVF